MSRRGRHRDRSRPRLVDLVVEATTAILARPSRSGLTALGTTLGIATLVSVVGVTQTASAQVSASFERANLRTVTAEVVPSGSAAPTPFGPADIARVERIRGVQSVGSLVGVTRDLARVRASLDPTRSTGDGANVIGAVPASFAAAGVHIGRGRTFDAGHLDRADRVAVIGQAAARRMGIADVSLGPAVFVGGVAFSVIGILERTDGFPDLLSAVIVPQSVVAPVFGASAVSRATMIVRAEPGATQVVGEQLAVIARPTAPESVQITAPPAPTQLRERIDGDLTSLLAVLAVVSLVIGLVGIANTSLVSVLERVHEFGLRRCLGATPIQNAIQVLTESTLLGLLGGIVGVSLGVLAVTSISVSRRWTPTLDVALLPASVLVGGIVGAIAGLYPAIRASSIDPDEALRR